MSKLNASKIKERLRQVPTLKIIFLKYLKCMDLYRSLLKTDHITWHNLKSGPETRNPRPYGPGLVTLGPGTWDAGTGTLGLGTCDAGAWDPDTRDPVNGTLGP